MIRLRLDSTQSLNDTVLIDESILNESRLSIFFEKMKNKKIKTEIYIFLHIKIF